MKPHFALLLLDSKETFYVPLLRIRPYNGNDFPPHLYLGLRVVDSRPFNLLRSTVDRSSDQVTNPSRPSENQRPDSARAPR